MRLNTGECSIGEPDDERDHPHSVTSIGHDAFAYACLNLTASPPYLRLRSGNVCRPSVTSIGMKHSA
jgi:hypothetical protein